MKLNLSKVQLNKAHNFTLKDTWVKETAKTIKENETYSITPPFELKLTFSKPSSGASTFLIKGNLHTFLNTTCSRCLTDFSYELNEDINLTAPVQIS